MDKNLTDYEIGLKGQLWINLPVTLIMIMSVFVTEMLLHNFWISFTIALFLGWMWWKFSAAKWVKWADQNNIDHNRLYIIGKSRWLIWSKKYIKDVVENNQKPWF
jgi:hypothetical protein